MNIKFYGDFLGHGDVAILEEVLTGTLYEQNSLKFVLKGVDLKLYFGDISIDSFCEFLCDI